MSSLIRDAPIGRIVRYLTNNRALQYPDELPGFQYGPFKDIDNLSDCTTEGTNTPQEHDDYQKSLDLSERCGSTASSSSELNRAIEHIATNQDLEKAVSTRPSQSNSSRPTPALSKDGSIVVGWYSTSDQENPQNWSAGKKAFVALVICFYTMAIYMGSSIITPSEVGIMSEFGVGPEAASLVLALYTLAYGIGPLIFSPISEIASIGRNPPYIITMFIFTILCIPAALVQNFAGLLVLRFLQGFFGSPCLATGGATLGDMYSFLKLPYLLTAWALAATLGPAVGPLISGYSVVAETWRWSLWEMLWIAGPAFLLMAFLLPETSPDNILFRRAQRLRKVTGDSRYKAPSEMGEKRQTAKDLVFEALVRPMQLMIMDPAIGFTAAYTSLTYGIYYSFFEVFPLVYIDMYGFDLGEMGLSFLSIAVGAAIAVTLYTSYLYFIMEPDFRANGPGQPEKRLVPALFASFLCPVALFLFGWTANPQIHWIVPTIGITIYTIGLFTIIQCIFLYLAMSYPRFAASLFAGNDFARSSIAFASVMFSRPMYLGLGVAPGVSLLAGLTACCIAGIFVLYFFGEALRRRSRFTTN